MYVYARTQNFRNGRNSFTELFQWHNGLRRHPGMTRMPQRYSQSQFLGLSAGWTGFDGELRYPSLQNALLCSQIAPRPRIKLLGRILFIITTVYNILSNWFITIFSSASVLVTLTLIVFLIPMICSRLFSVIRSSSSVDRRPLSFQARASHFPPTSESGIEPCCLVLEPSPPRDEFRKNRGRNLDIGALSVGRQAHIMLAQDSTCVQTKARPVASVIVVSFSRYGNSRP